MTKHMVCIDGSQEADKAFNDALSRLSPTSDELLIATRVRSVGPPPSMDPVGIPSLSAYQDVNAAVKNEADALLDTYLARARAEISARSGGPTAEAAGVDARVRGSVLAGYDPRE
eukprot:CAMPEP_0174904316 /NCGR_PEP_ID=MMETSP0167-20121228/48071_1 /TAXON_ID=38298 /ORGANISM="Rhodella maculata, Strain CCMP736" /LENGTH=114 /DNA_ID=CAMNT_0016146925 /DNA_START=193 /DNA_END=537 /DNA_ORIENTATION=+